MREINKSHSQIHQQQPITIGSQRNPLNKQKNVVDRAARDLIKYISFNCLWSQSAHNNFSSSAELWPIFFLCGVYVLIRNWLSVENLASYRRWKKKKHEKIYCHFICCFYVRILISLSLNGKFLWTVFISRYVISLFALLRASREFFLFLLIRTPASAREVFLPRNKFFNAH